MPCGFLNYIVVRLLVEVGCHAGCFFAASFERNDTSNEPAGTSGSYLIRWNSNRIGIVLDNYRDRSHKSIGMSGFVVEVYLYVYIRIACRQLIPFERQLC